MHSGYQKNIWKASQEPLRVFSQNIPREVPKNFRVSKEYKLLKITKNGVQNINSEAKYEFLQRKKRKDLKYYFLYQLKRRLCQ